MNETETYYHLFGNSITLSQSDSLAIIGIVVSFGVGILFYCLDWRRKKEIDKSHKKVIRSQMDELEDIFARIMLDVNRIEEDEIGISERLNHFLIGEYDNIKFLINNIKLHQVQCSKLSDNEIKDIQNTVKVSQWLLKKYCPQDIPETRRIGLWRSYDSTLRDQATLLSDSIRNFKP